jgi:hypothetical protein
MRAKESDQLRFVLLIGAYQFEFVTVLAQESSDTEILAQFRFQIVDIAVLRMQIYIISAGINDIEKLSDLFVGIEFHFCPPFVRKNAENFQSAVKGWRSISGTHSAIL